jgi:hypothetical protein
MICDFCQASLVYNNDEEDFEIAWDKYVCVNCKHTPLYLIQYTNEPSMPKIKIIRIFHKEYVAQFLYDPSGSNEFEIYKRFTFEDEDETIFKVDYIPEINPDNLEQKLKLILPFI